MAEQTLLNRMFQGKISDDAYRRIKVAAAQQLCTGGEIVDELVIKHLAPVGPVEPEQN